MSQGMYGFGIAKMGKESSKERKFINIFLEIEQSFKIQTVPQSTHWGVVQRSACASGLEPTFPSYNSRAQGHPAL